MPRNTNEPCVPSKILETVKFNDVPNPSVQYGASIWISDRASACGHLVANTSKSKIISYKSYEECRNDMMAGS